MRSSGHLPQRLRRRVGAALDDEGDEHPRQVALAYLPQVDGAQRAAALVRRHGTAGGRGRRDALTQHRRHTREGGRQHAAAWDVDDLVATALREEAHLGRRRRR